jgi:hypothetical protein
MEWRRLIKPKWSKRPELVVLRAGLGGRQS